jgi:hypothetical protein
LHGLCHAEYVDLKGLAASRNEERFASGRNARDTAKRASPAAVASNSPVREPHRRRGGEGQPLDHLKHESITP